jgi:hypothetical protein
MDLLTTGKSRVSLALLSVIALGSAGCATSGPYITNHSHYEVLGTAGENHRIEYLTIFEDEDDGKVVLYGKVEHHHETWDKEPHVDVTVDDPSGKQILSRTLKLKRADGHKQRGWYGASFRTDISPLPPEGSKIVVAVHDGECTLTNGASK